MQEEAVIAYLVPQLQPTQGRAYVRAWRCGQGFVNIDTNVCLHEVAFVNLQINARHESSGL
jgi:hypothetical protein